MIKDSPKVKKIGKKHASWNIFYQTFNTSFWPAGDEGSMPADIATLLKTSMGLWNENC